MAHGVREEGGAPTPKPQALKIPKPSELVYVAEGTVIEEFLATGIFLI